MCLVLKDAGLHPETNLKALYQLILHVHFEMEGLFLLKKLYIKGTTCPKLTSKMHTFQSLYIWNL